jgi:hypothetical protein
MTLATHTPNLSGKHPVAHLEVAEFGWIAIDHESRRGVDPYFCGFARGRLQRDDGTRDGSDLATHAMKIHCHAAASRPVLQRRRRCVLLCRRSSGKTDQQYDYCR